MAAVPAVLLLGTLPLVAVVPDDEMAPSLYAGDFILVLPTMVRRGDVVPVVDPLEPSRWTLRRVEAIGGAVRYEGGAYYAGEGTFDVLEMGRDETWVTVQEGDHLARLSLRGTRWVLPESSVPDDMAFLGADARDEAMDSRWWGPLPVTALQGVVALRVGRPRHPWRGWVSTAP